MELAIFLDITIILIISLILFQKTLHLFENIFMFLVTDIVFMNYMGVLYDNTKILELSAKIDHLIIFHLYEVIVIPILTVWYFNFLYALKDSFRKWMLTIYYLFTVYAVEFLLLKWEVFHTKAGMQACHSLECLRCF